eukprot:scaffold1724_cov341-Pavlova_lutheri.AAC.58
MEDTFARPLNLLRRGVVPSRVQCRETNGRDGRGSSRGRDRCLQLFNSNGGGASMNSRSRHTSKLREMSSAGTECVSAPLET